MSAAAVNIAPASLSGFLSLKEYKGAGTVEGLSSNFELNLFHLFSTKSRSGVPC